MSESIRIIGDRYQLGQAIGYGGMAEVYLGTDLKLGRDVAVKILRPDLARDPVFLNRFRREAQSAAGLNHRNIVSVYDTGEDEIEQGVSKVLVPWIVMEKVEGYTLKQILKSGRKISPERALDITSGILSALEFSHRNGIVHRDIKPANIMITQHGDVKVMDFGIARAVTDASATATHSNTVLGTAQYLSPEQAKGETVDSRSDLYSTGCVLFELLTGRPPFTGESPVAIAYQHVSEMPPIASGINPDVPLTYDPVVQKALAKTSAERYQTAGEMRADVELLLKGFAPTEVTSARDIDKTQTIASVNPSEKTEKTMNKSRVGIIVGGAAGAIALVVGAIMLVTTLINPAPVTQVTVPDIVGLTIDQANTNLIAEGLVLGEVEYQVAPDRPVNTIISQNPGKETEVNKGTAVNVIVSKGKGQVQVPDLINYVSVDDARQALYAVGLTLGPVTYEDSDKPKETVLGTDPIAGTVVDEGTAISVVVSSGKLKVPNVVGMTESDAKNALKGFVITIIYEESDVVTAGTVISQTPAGDVQADPGSSVTIVVAKTPSDPTEDPGDPNG
ncbi:MAG: Stk1 family PASTA domain-containing Ser/Thr kinase [Candidatus Nanopelagicales bacterium]